MHNFNNKNKILTTIPTKIINGLKIAHLGKECEISFPLAMYETTLFASVARGVRISKQHPIIANVISSCMTRSVILECKNSYECVKLKKLFDAEKNTKFQIFQTIVNETWFIIIVFFFFFFFVKFIFMNEIQEADDDLLSSIKIYNISLKKDGDSAVISFIDTADMNN